MQALSAEDLSVEDDYELVADAHELLVCKRKLRNSKREVYTSAGLLMKYPSPLTTTYIFNYLSGGSVHL